MAAYVQQSNCIKISIRHEMLIKKKIQICLYSSFYRNSIMAYVLQRNWLYSYFFKHVTFLYSLSPLSNKHMHKSNFEYVLKLPLDMQY